MMDAIHDSFALGCWGTKEAWGQSQTEFTEDGVRDIPGREDGGCDGLEAARLTHHASSSCHVSALAFPMPGVGVPGDRETQTHICKDMEARGSGGRGPACIWESGSDFSEVQLVSLSLGERKKNWRGKETH